MTIQIDPEQIETKYLHQFADFRSKRVLEKQKKNEEYKFPVQ